MLVCNTRGARLAHAEWLKTWQAAAAGLVGISPSYDEGSMIKRQQMRRGNSGNERGGRGVKE